MAKVPLPIFLSFLPHTSSVRMHWGEFDYYLRISYRAAHTVASKSGASETFALHFAYTLQYYFKERL